MINLNKIVIVGGGSAGWMSAATMVRAFPDKEIIVIESPDYPIVGVGESTLGGITGWANWIGIDEKDFMPATDAVYKMSIKFTDFYKKDDFRYLDVFCYVVDFFSQREFFEMCLRNA